MTDLNFLVTRFTIPKTEGFTIKKTRDSLSETLRERHLDDGLDGLRQTKGHRVINLIGTSFKCLTDMGRKSRQHHPRRDRIKVFGCFFRLSHWVSESKTVRACASIVVI
jgi:hypothetical protein